MSGTLFGLAGINGVGKRYPRFEWIVGHSTSIFANRKLSNGDCRHLI